MERLTLTLAQEAGSVSNRNSKMPGSTFAVSAKHCQTGGKLADIEGSTCHKCYALRIQAIRPSVDKGWTSNLDKAVRLIETDPERWAKFMAYQINRLADKSGERYHRWFDSGDLQSFAMLLAIVRVCELTPDVKHWLPTRETKFVKEYRYVCGEFPSNLVVRVSSVMINDDPISSYRHTSTVHNKHGNPVGHVCPASKQGNACGECRACWSSLVPNVSYPLH